MSNNYRNIPQELRDCPQWIVWALEDRDGVKPTKVPYSAATGNRASTTDPATWSTFDHVVACAAAQDKTYAGIGFVFTENDPYCGIDLDDPHEKNPDGSTKHPNPENIMAVQRKIHETFDCYSELSPSGRGLHIICRGAVPNGRRRSSVELYSSGRFFTFTGNVVSDKPIRPQDNFVAMLWHELGGKIETYTYGGDIVEKLTDEEVITKAHGAVNGDKFASLHRGDLSAYPSQSEADQAYMNFLAFYSQHRNQLMRLFRNSPLGQRDKAQRNSYLNYTINRAFDQMLPPIDLEGFRNQVDDVLAKMKTPPEAHTTVEAGGVDPAQDLNQPIARPTPQINLSAQIAAALGPAPIIPKAPMPVQRKVPSKQPSVEFPPGLVGEIADYIYQVSPRPVKEISLAAAVGLMAGIAGRSYNYSGAGLNQYILLLAPTGRGKEAISGGVSKIMSKLTEMDPLGGGMAAVPGAKEFVGPSELPSGPGLHKVFKDRKSFVSIVGEIGLWMQKINHPRASAADQSIKSVLLNVYNKSGKGNVLGGSAYSDKEKNSHAVKSPAFTFMGEGTPATFYEGLDENLIANGFLPRFLTFIYEGDRPALRKDHGKVEPSTQLMDRLAALSVNCLTLNNADQVIDVKASPEADARLDEINTHADALMNSPDRKEILDELWNRCHFKTFKLAALVAVGMDPDDPVITIEAVEWAYDIVLRDIKSYVRKFEIGEIGANANESRQVRDIISVVGQYLTLPYNEVVKYARCSTQMHQDHVVPYAYLQRRLVSVATFRHDRMGATNAIKRTIQTMLDEGVIMEAGRADLDKYGTKSGRAYVIVDPARFL